MTSARDTLIVATVDCTTDPNHHVMAIRLMGDGYTWFVFLGFEVVEFLLMAIDYFTKWVEAKPLAKIIEACVKDFV